ncbi:SDR family oxidoreductase [Mycobacterium gastri]|uniref:Short-chain dehydrogenase n=1 Tax=Mycobacterium gastri TaxID=1777 RepID=A0A1X1W1A4_MYCGS|nr:SDR family oxidoreductase [Mycobacterium gastri]ETW26757.1 short-chain dehydrogenase [Mycobacterium gastri 'Wayne']ORV79870.1 short-chain dehydrogenase [Mycobacterium gastri]
MKTVVITGATAGIGRATALRFDRAGYRVAAYGRNKAALDELRAQLRPEAVVDTLDIQDADAWTTRLGELAEITGGQLDVLINNAGILTSGPFAETPLAAQRSIIDVNVGGTMAGCHAAYPYLRSTPKAQVINLCSASAIYGQAELAAYSASKFAIRGLTEALELEWADDDIRVCAVWPLFVDTGMVQGVDTGSTRALGVSLTADGVADSILKTAQSRPRLPHGPHYAIGWQAEAFMTISSFVPSWVLREINRRATGH